MNKYNNFDSLTTEWNFLVQEMVASECVNEEIQVLVRDRIGWRQYTRFCSIQSKKGLQSRGVQKTVD